jgi:hypothetical protein
MKKRKQKWLILLILFSIILTVNFGCSGKFKLNESDFVSTAIVCPGNNIAVTFAAQELQKHILLITGHKVPIVPKYDSNKKVFYIGVVPETDKKALQPEESRYLIARDAVYLYGEDNIADNRSSDIETITNFGSNRTGTLFAVYNFLEKELGVHWIEPGDDGIYYIPSVNIVLKATSDSWLSPFTLARGFRVTSFGLRSYWPSEEKIVPAEFQLNPDQANAKIMDTRLWLKRMRMGNRGPKLQLGHAFTSWWEKYGKTHPEYFALNGNGVRAPLGRIARVKMCPSNPELAKQIVEDWYAAKQAGMAGDIFSICENDGDGRGMAEFCHCDSCKALDFLKPGEEFGANLTDRYVYLSNKVIALARKYDPNASPSTYAYGDYLAPPREIKVDSGVVLGFVPLFNDDFNFTNGIYEGWRKMNGRRIVLRTNDLYVEFGLPLGTEKRVYEHFQLAVKNGAAGTDWDQCLGFWTGIAGLNYYVLAKGHVDPTRSFDYWEDEFASMYGKAKEDIKKYYRYWREEVFEKRLYPADRERAKVHYDGYLNYSDVVAYGINVDKYYNKTDFDKTDKFLKDASEKKLNRVQRNLLDKLILSSKHNRIQYEAMLANQTGNFESSKKAAKKLLDFRIKNKDALLINWSTLFESQHHKGDMLGLDKL